MKLVSFYLSVLVTCMSLASPALAFEKFCKGVPNWPKGSTVPAAAEYKDVGAVVDGNFAHSKWKQKDWTIIDARSKGDRKVGKVSKTALITADYKDASKNQFDEKTIVKKLNKLHKSSFKSLKAVVDSGHHFILFCNGPTCHRSSFGACEMRKMGVPKERIHLMLGGYPEWKRTDKGS